MNPQYANLLIMLVFILAMYFFMIRPNSKRKKQEQEMRSNVSIGDEITTIGGIVGRVVGIKEDEDSLVIETGIDRSKVKIKKWAIASREMEKTESSK